ncbi:hypothetical protein EG68_10048 [Paragonimus skrjabini miyazakii]|uniref:BZIP domain-containing protein n=1 Tax=Paragonimus skrjabini miyazakii TaxID=59628 RepID=A0A8S9YKF2_9TREM|nr:hypothetical protein EG68_10048 [Paragonimus skrjabini miyazakii]
MGLSELSLNFVLGLCLIILFWRFFAERVLCLLFPVGKTRKYSLDLFISMPWTRHRFGLNVNVLLHELYPAKEASGTSPLDRDERLSPQDFLQALQKMDPDGAVASNLEEANFLFQTNQLPISSFTTWAPTSRCKPGTSGSSTIECNDTPNWSDTEKPNATDTVAESAPATNVFIPFGASEQTDSFVHPPRVDGNACDSSTACAPRSYAGKERPSSEPVSNDTTYPADLLPFEPIKADEEEYEDAEYSRYHLPLHSTFDALTVTAEPTQWRFRQVDESVNNEEEETSHVSGLASCSSLTDEVIVDNYKVVPDEWICSSLSQTSDKSSNAPLKSESQSSNAAPRMSRRKAVLKPCNAEQRPNRNISLSSGSDLNKSIAFQAGSSSDSELDYRPTGSSEWRNGHPFPFRRRTTHCSDLCLGDSFSHRSTPSESDSHSLITVRKSYGSSRSPGERNGTSDCDTNNLSYCPSTSSNKRPDRHLRDVLALEEFKIPFSYDEIIYSTNEQFRELKATPNLTQDQINMMLDARKRATNRQAAERCRRLKTATRDELSERLCALRLERQILTRQIAHARQRKQRACDALLAEQKRVLALLRGPDGNQLKYSDWHVRLTHDDEVVLVAVGR